MNILHLFLGEMSEIQVNPKVSVIVPVFNMRAYVQNCVDSLIRQTYKNLEIILVDDGSTDDSGEICDTFALMDERIIVIHKKNGGLSDARNRGTNLATGEYIMYLDADDWLEDETCMSTVQAAIDKDAEIVFWGYRKEFGEIRCQEFRLFETDKVFSGESLLWLQRRLIGLVDKELINPTRTDAYNSAWGKLYQKNLISRNSISFIDTKVIGSEDVLFNIMAFHKASKIVYVNELFNHYRQDNPQAITKNHNSTLFPRFLNLFDSIAMFIKENHLDNEYTIALNNRIVLSVINCALGITSKKNTEGMCPKIRVLKEILKNNVYRNASKQFKLKYLPLYWQAYFMLCKIQLASGVLFLTLIIRKLR